MNKYKGMIDPSTNRSNKTKNMKPANFGSKAVQREVSWHN